MPSMAKTFTAGFGAKKESGLALEDRSKVQVEVAEDEDYEESQDLEDDKEIHNDENELRSHRSF